MRFEIHRQDMIFLVVAGLLVLLYVLVAGSGFPLDDSWIHQTYGRNLAAGGEWAFIEGQPSAASTAPLYTVALALGYKLTIPFQVWTHGLGVLALAFTGMLGARMAIRLAPDSRFIGYASGMALILAWHLVWAAASGMETMLFSMFTLALIWFAWRELDAERSASTQAIARRGIVFGIVAALAALTRPEAVVLAGLVGLSMLIVRPQGTWRLVVVWGVGAAVGFLAAIAPYLIVNLNLTGGLLPDTAAAKQAEFAPLLARSYPTRVVDMLLPLVGGGQIVLLPGMVLFASVMLRRLRAGRRALLYLLPLLWAGALVGLYAARLPTAFQHGRYVIPSLPALILVGVVGTLWLLRWGRASRAGRVLTQTLAISALVIFVYLGIVLGPGVYANDVAIIDQEMVAAARWIEVNIPPEELLAVHDIGAVGYYAPRPILDLAGLVSPEIVPLIGDEEALWALMQARGARYLMAFPDQIPGRDVSDRRLCPVFDTEGEAAPIAGGSNMVVYELVWVGNCAT